MSNLVNHAQSELHFAGLLKKDTDFYGGAIGKAVIELMEVFSKQGHSGSSAPLVADIFKRLANYENLTPISGEDSEFVDIMGEGLMQNVRNSAVFKNNGRYYYIDGMVKRLSDGTCWSGGFYTDREAFEARDESKKLYTTRAYIKSFPFTPKTFYIDVEEVEVAPDDWEMYATNPAQLKEVTEYYDLQ